jgi:cytochrome b6-f complex iron-sulfur subunit
MNEQGMRVLKTPEERSTSHAAVRSHLGHPDLTSAALRKCPSQAGSRRNFLRASIASMGALALWLMDVAAKRSASIPENMETALTLPWNAARGIHFYDRVIVINKPSQVAVFSSACTHMGCRLNASEGSELVCPCHGSRFNLNGEPVQGPARKRLRALPFTLDRTQAVIRVNVER